VTKVWAGQCTQFLTVQRDLFFKMSKQALGPPQPPVQWKLGDLSPWVKWSEHEADPNSPDMPSWHAQG